MKRNDVPPDRTGEEIVERLIRIADAGPDIPEGGAARVKAAIRPAWEGEVRRRSRRRQIRWTAAFAAAAALALLAIGLRQITTPAPEPIGRVELVRGGFAITSRGEEMSAASSGALIHRGDVLRTEHDDRAALRLSNGTYVRVDDGTTLRVRSAELFVLESGTVYLESGPGASLEIRTPLGAVRDIGTRFEVRHQGGATRVRVRDGSVFVLASGQAVQVNDGRELTVAADGAVQSGEVTLHGEPWAWILELSPAFEIDGKSVAAFLGWVERETALEVHFADPQTERAARNAILHGTLAGLRADEAPDVILPSAGLEAVRNDGVLYVRPIQ